MIDLGVLGAGRLGSVDPFGGITPNGVAWTLRWWVGAEDRWHTPTADAAVRQSLVGHTPVVETRLRVPGGDIVHHAFAVTGPGGTTALAAEVTNESAVPVAIGVVVDGGSAGPCVGLDDTVIAVGDHRVQLPKAPAGFVAPAAFLPLTHKATLRMAVTVGEGADAVDLDELPEADRVAAGWRAQLGAGARWVLPEPTVAAAADAARGFLLLHDRPDLFTAALVAEARRAVGLSEPEAARRLLVAGQQGSGAFDDGTGSPAATAQALVTLGPDADPGPDGELVGPVAKAAHRIEKERHGRRDRKDPLRAGLLPAGVAPPPVGGEGRHYWDDWWAIAGLARAAGLLAASGQPEAATDVEGFARSLAEDLARSIAATTADDRRGVVAVPAGPGRAVDAAAAGVVVGAAVGGADPADPSVVATLDHLRATEDLDDWAPWVLALLARCELAVGDAAGLDRLQSLATSSEGLGVWGRPGGPDHDPLASAAFLLAVRSLLVVETGPLVGPAEGLAVLPVIDPTWFGQGIEVHDTPTGCGRFGFAVRWHGERPAMLWELDATDPARPFRLTAPGLDPAWSATDPVGEALLAPAPVDDLGSFS